MHVGWMTGEMRRERDACGMDDGRDEERTGCMWDG